MSASAASSPPGATLAELVPDWDAPPQVRAFVTGRRGGTSAGPWGLADGSRGGLNLGTRCGDDARDVARNRARLGACLPSPPRWLEQVHGAAVHVATAHRCGTAIEPRADAAATATPGVVLAVLSADCLPVLLTDTGGQAVAVAHAGWRGLALGVLERSVEALHGLVGPGAQVIAWLGPAIGPRAFEVGEDVLRAFCDADPRCAAAFVPGVRDGKWFADLCHLARICLARVDVHRVAGGGHCTAGDPARFYSHRRDRGGGRMASLIWLDPA